MAHRRDLSTTRTAPLRCDTPAGPGPSPAGALDVHDHAAAARVLRALADPTRLGILALLTRHGAQCVCHITAAFPLGQPTISHHLRLLRESGLVDCERRGTWCYYFVRSAARPVVAWALAIPAALIADERGAPSREAPSRGGRGQQGSVGGA